MYRTPGEFFRIASEIRHPFDTPLPIEDANLKAIQALVEKGPHFVANFRVEQLKKYMALARNLEPKERLLKESMHPDVRQVMQSKRLLLFGKMLKDAGVQDERLLQDMVDGFRLVGQRALHALAQMGLTSEIPVVRELEPPSSPGASEADTLTDTLSATTPFASPRAPGEVAPTAPDVATPRFTPTAAPAHWHGVGPPTAAPGVRLSWLYVPLLHAAAGNLAPEADAAWRSAPGTGATWAAIVATLRDGPPVDPQLLARMAHQAAEAEVAAGEATEPELAPALARARALGRERAIGGSFSAAMRRGMYPQSCRQC